MKMRGKATNLLLGKTIVCILIREHQFDKIFTKVFDAYITRFIFVVYLITFSSYLRSRITFATKVLVIPTSLKMVVRCTIHLMATLLLVPSLDR